MAGPYDLTGQNIENTYQRILQTPDGTTFYDGTGSAVTFTATATAGGSNTQVQFNSASLLSGSSNFTFDYVNSNVILTGSFDFNAAANAIPNQAGRLHWNDEDGTLELGLKGGVVSSLLGQGLVTRVVNKTVPNIDLLAANYQVVVVSGAQGQRLAIKLAKADNDANSAGTLGLIAENINKNQEGFIVTVGLLKNRNTTGALQGETWNDGDVLYLSPTTAGAITNIKPQAPQHTVIVGYVEYAHQNNGKIYVKIDNGYELDELHNVRINTASLATGDLLIYDSGSLLWKNSKTLSGSYILSGSLVTNDGVQVQSLTASFVSASSITGSLFGTASWATRAVTSSYALQAQNATTANTADTANQSDNVLVKGYDAHENGVVYPFLMPKNLDIPANSQGYSSLVNNNDFVYTSFDSGTPAFSMPISTSVFIIGVQGENSASLIVHGEVKANKFITLTNTIEFTDLIVTGSRAALLTLSVSSSNLVVSGGNILSNVTGSLHGTASWASNAVLTVNAQTASYVNPLNQNVLITGSLDISNQNGTSPFLIKSGSLPVLTVTGSGVTVLGTFASPPPVASGGIYFDGTDFYLGV